jgi:uncharacterized protein (TIGR02001 family)
VAFRRATWLSAVAAASTIAFAQPAIAQVGATIGYASDYRLRGVSLTNRLPAVTLSGTYDHPNGIYAGGAAILYDPGGSPVRWLGHTEYLGYAWRTARGPTFDVGVNNVDMGGAAHPTDYTQVYLGATQSNVSAHVYLAPNNPRHGESTAYLDLNGVMRPEEDWRLTGHLGALRRIGGEGTEGRRNRYDLQVGVAHDLGRLELELSGVAVLHPPRPQGPENRTGLIAGVSLSF